MSAFDIVDLENKIKSSWSVGELVEVRPLSGGLVNDTYLVDTALGSFVYQILGASFDSSQVIVDQVVISQVLNLSGVKTPQIVLTNEGLPYAKIGSRFSKLSNYIPNTPNPRRMMGETMVRSLSATLARLHLVMSKVDYTPKYSLPHFHDASYILRRLLHVVVANQGNGKFDRVSDEFRYLIKNLPLHFLCEPHEKQLIHGDPKLDNFLFGSDEGVIAVIDLDTFMIGSVLLDIGDAFRSWLQSSDGTFNRDLAKIAIREYRAVNPVPYTDNQFLSATRLLSLELATRFLTDYFEESYFKWDSSKFESLSVQNLERARRMIKFAESVSF